MDGWSFTKGRSIIHMPGNGQQQLSRWSFTINNWTPEEKNGIDGLVEGGKATYVCYGLEVGAEGTPHIQGYIEFARKRRLGGVRELLGGRAHVTGSNGTGEQNKDYCGKGEQSKDEWDEFKKLGPNWGINAEFFEFGEIKSQGKRTDLERVKETIDNGGTIDELWDQHFGSMVRYERSFKKYRGRTIKRNSSITPEIYVLWGPTGTGKSRFPRMVDPDLFSVPDVKLKWWDGYEGDEVIIFDDFDGKEVQIADFLRMTDRYHVQVAVKGSFEPLMARRIWISSNTSPDDWFPNETQVKRDAVRRRLTKVINLIGPINFEDEIDILHIKVLLGIE